MRTFFKIIWKILKVYFMADVLLLAFIGFANILGNWRWDDYRWKDYPDAVNGEFSWAVNQTKEFFSDRTKIKFK